MRLIGGIARTILATWIFFWIAATLWFALSGQTEMALLSIVVLLVPLSMITYEYWQGKRNVP